MTNRSNSVEIGGTLRNRERRKDMPMPQHTESRKLPSGGDTSYAGMVWHDGMLWISYYSSHEEKTAVYLARVTLGNGKGNTEN